MANSGTAKTFGTTNFAQEFDHGTMVVLLVFLIRDYFSGLFSGFLIIDVAFVLFFLCFPQ